MQPTALLTTTTTADTAPGATLDFPLPVGTDAVHFLADQTVYLEVYARRFEGLSVTFTDDVATVTWPADAPYPLPVDEYYVEVQTNAPQGLPDDVGQAAHVPPVTGVADTIPIAIDPAADLAAAVAAINILTECCIELLGLSGGNKNITNMLLANLQAANLMADE